ncbi:hypothetical protein HN604_03755 [archaeon]|jgi:hypothetical protein|nr:hypothetical protein [archaeon]MBT6182961.1 hypothetical protein [archaeon]MBT6606574.1 hypothetical protein [archaeon]MBT7251799.1 hypothetical protein [archaeon]MBT7661168.1 hypothetical protein [archaeon]
MEDKELIRRVRNSIRAKKSQAQILNGFLDKGYKLEYAEKIIAKAKLPKRVFGIFVLFFIVFFSISIASYTLFSNNEKGNLKNPLDSLSVTGNVVGLGVGDLSDIESIEITPEFISYLLNEVGVWRLHAHPITFEKPLIITQLDDKYFSSTIGEGIETIVGSGQEADVQIGLSKEILMEILSTDEPEEIVRNYLDNGEILVTPLAGETTLLAKGYLKLYGDLE